MVSFRFHIVSIVAVFLALALGIGMGVTVIDKATVDLLQTRLDNVSAQVQAANQRSDDLQRQLARTENFDEAAADYLTAGRLSRVPVTVVGVRGVAPAVHDSVRQSLQEAGASVQGTLWFTEKANLTNRSDTVALQRILDTDSAEPDELRQALVARVSAVLAGGSEGGQLSDLVSAGFLDWDAATAPRDVSMVDFTTGRVVALSSPNSVIPAGRVMVPLAKLLAAQPNRRVVVAEVGQPAGDGQPEQRAIVRDEIQQDSTLNDRLSTVDNVEAGRGRVALVLALSQLDAGRTGDYGVAPSADSPLPRLQQ